MDIEVVLVNPVYEGNVGAVARVMKNFGYSELTLINPCELGAFARAMASHAQDVLDGARRKTLEDVLVASNLVIGTTGIAGSKASLRAPYELVRLGGKLSEMRGIASILFGPEDQGLSNDVLQECDVVVNVETSTQYPVMNISHAAAVILYSIASSTTPAARRTVATHEDLGRLLQHTSEVLEEIDFPAHKRRRVLLNLKRIWGRSELSTSEVRTLRGILSRIELRLRR
ncbi:MAG TPA: RNA methyltransferase [Candidatus Bathyarchaeia archaeon]|nr:RNA methyltransferase [Candidatus Bathyarchaeia archaeon]